MCVQLTLESGLGEWDQSKILAKSIGTSNGEPCLELRDDMF